MAETFSLKEHSPFPNNILPVIYYPKALSSLLEDCKKEKPEEAVKALFANNGYSQAWTNGIHDTHHFHSNTYEVLACISGEANVQLGGPHAGTYTFSKGMFCCGRQESHIRECTQPVILL